MTAVFVIICVTVIVVITTTLVNRDSSVGIATRYGMDGPGIESRLGAQFSAPVQTGPGTHPASYTIGTGSLSWGVKRPGRGVDHPPLSSAKVKERILVNDQLDALFLNVFISCLYVFPLDQHVRQSPTRVCYTR
jgi:hypothetical protein